MQDRDWALFGRYWEDVYASRHVAVRLGGADRRNRIAKIVLEEFERTKDQNLTPAAMRASLRARVKARLRDERVGFVWWLPVVLWAAEVIIEILVKLWMDRHE